MLAFWENRKGGWGSCMGVRDAWEKRRFGQVSKPTKGSALGPLHRSGPHLGAEAPRKAFLGSRVHTLPQELPSWKTQVKASLTLRRETTSSKSMEKRNRWIGVHTEKANPCWAMWPTAPAQAHLHVARPRLTSWRGILSTKVYKVYVPGHRRRGPCFQQPL